MNRLQRDTKLINDMSLNDLFKQDVTGIQALAIVVGLYLIAWYANSAPGTLSAWFSSQSALRGYLVEETPADREICRSSICTYPFVTTRETRPVFLAPARYTPPASTTVRAPEGQFIVLETVWMRNDGFGWPLNGSGYMIGLTTPLARDTPVGDRSEYTPLLIKTPGYVRTGRMVETDALIRLSAAPDTGTQPPDLLNARFSEVDVQPLETAYRLIMPSPPSAPLEVGETARLIFDVGHIPQAGKEGENPAESLQVVITEVFGESVGRERGIAVRLAEAQFPIGLLAQRVRAERKRGQAAFPSEILVELTPHYGRGEGQVFRVPATALARRGEDTFVWHDVGGFALPVWVRELGRVDDDDVLVTERLGARGLPVRPDDWRGLSAYQRGETLRAAAHPDDTRLNQLLVKDSRVIAHPDERLVAGLPIRSGDASR